jgi:hypothetical protein
VSLTQVTYDEAAKFAKENGNTVVETKGLIAFLPELIFVEASAKTCVSYQRSVCGVARVC